MTTGLAGLSQVASTACSLCPVTAFWDCSRASFATVTGSLLPDTFQKPGSNHICPCSVPSSSSRLASASRGSGLLEGLNLHLTSSLRSRVFYPGPSRAAISSASWFYSQDSFFLFTRGAQSPEGLLFSRC